MSKWEWTVAASCQRALVIKIDCTFFFSIREFHYNIHQYRLSSAHLAILGRCFKAHQSLDFV